MMRSWAIVVLCVGTYFASAQKFVSERSIGPIDADGFYRIDLSPELMPDINGGMSNVRIVDAAGREVPYLLREEQPASYSQTFRSYRILQYDKQKNCCTSIILENPDNKAINNVHLSLRNADVTKVMILTGSDDRQNWYALKQKSSISAAGDGKNTSTMRLLDFPLSNYAYYKIDIDDSTSAPLNIMGAGYFELNTSAGNFSDVPVEWDKTDSAAVRRTYVKLRFKRQQVMDRIELSMKGAPYFLRRGTLLREIKPTRKKTKPYFERLTSFTVSSRQPAVIEVDAERGNEFILEIENEDNPPLEVDNIRIEQLQRYLVAWLPKGEGYLLKFGPAQFATPHYDLVNFSDSIPPNLVAVKVGPLKSIKQAQAEESRTFFTSTVAIWVAIVAVIGILGFMAVRMVREMKA
jgi:hypothetical protein